jgi:acyl-CoA thioesterase-1
MKMPGFLARNVAASLIAWWLAAMPAALAQAPADLPVILAIGESTTAGFGVPADKAYPAQLQQLLDAQGYRYRVVNHGRSGSTTAMALNGLDRGMLLGPKIVLIALGGNDQGNRLAAARTQENLRKMVSLFVRSGALVFLADRNLAADRAAPEQASLFAELAAEEGALLMPSLRAEVAGHPELLLSDGSHPNGEGYAIVAARIFRLLQPYLDTQAAPPEADSASQR